MPSHARTVASRRNKDFAAARVLKHRCEVHRALVVVMVLAGSASAETRGTLRIGVLPLELRSSSDTPLFGARVDRAVTEYNQAAAAFDRRTGTTTARISAGDLGVAETLVMISPGVEGSAGHYVFRIEAPIGIGDDLKSVGLGVYPIGVQGRVRKGVALYASAGGTASWLDRPGTGDVGGLLTVRGVIGARFANRVSAEVGYSAFALGGSVNNAKLEGMMTGEALPEPATALSAGEARGLVDVSVGVSF